MSDTFWQVILTGFFTLLGTILGAIGSNWQASAAAKREAEKDERHRKWSLRDFTRDRRLSIRDKRCEQAEKYTSAMSNDFHQFRTHITRLLMHHPELPPPPELHDFMYWERKIDTDIFQYGPVVLAISSNKHDLRSSWDKMSQAWRDMAMHYGYVYKTVIVDRQLVPTPEKLSKDITSVYDSFNAGLREFYITIDKIKSSRLM